MNIWALNVVSFRFDDGATTCMHLAMKWHPDRHANHANRHKAEEQFKEIQRAYPRA